MIIGIESSAFQNENQDFLKPGFIHAVSSLVNQGFEISISDSDLSTKQKEILKHEGISISSSVIEKSDAIISFDSASSTFACKKEDSTIIEAKSWSEILAPLLKLSDRRAELARKTNETDIKISLNLDGTGKSSVSTGLKFFDHMLDQIAKHGFIDLDLSCVGDLEVDEHHTIEDVAIALGETISKALGDKRGIERYSFVLPMDEAQATVALDLSGRPYLQFDVPLKREYVGDFPTEMLEHFFYSLAMNLKATLHVKCTGENDHHKMEACFKGFARTLKSAVEQNGRIKNQIPSSKGSL